MCAYRHCLLTREIVGSQGRFEDSGLLIYDCRSQFVSVQWKPTWFIFSSQFVSSGNFYKFRENLYPIIRKYIIYTALLRVLLFSWLLLAVQQTVKWKSKNLARTHVTQH